jgi:hypothetical protein
MTLSRRSLAASKLRVAAPHTMVSTAPSHNSGLPTPASFWVSSEDGGVEDVTAKTPLWLIFDGSMKGARK